MTLIQAACDCLISLHRAEGFGLNIAECMGAGKIVIATNFSGNTDFTRPENSLLVPYKMAEVGKQAYIHGSGPMVGRTRSRCSCQCYPTGSLEPVRHSTSS